MATAAEYKQWLIDNKADKGSPRYNFVRDKFKVARTAELETTQSKAAAERATNMQATSGEKLADLGISIAEGANLNLDDEWHGLVHGTIDSVKDMGRRTAKWLSGDQNEDESGILDYWQQRYNAHRNAWRKRQDLAHERSPVLTFIGETAGGITTSMLPYGGLAKAAGIARQVPTTAKAMAKEGVPWGMVYGYGSSEAEAWNHVLADTAMGAALGSIGGGATGVVTQQGKKILASRAKTNYAKLLGVKDAYVRQGLNEAESARRASRDLLFGEARERAAAKRGLTEADIDTEKLMATRQKALDKYTKKIAKAEVRKVNPTNLYRSAYDQLYKISPKLGGTLRRFEFTLRDNKRKRLGAEGLDLIDKHGDIAGSAAGKAWKNVPENIKEKIRLAYANGDEPALKDALAHESVTDDVRVVFDKWKRVRQDYWDRYQQLGIDLERVPNYYPVVFKNEHALINFNKKNGFDKVDMDARAAELMGEYGYDAPMMAQMKRTQQMNKELAKPEINRPDLRPTSQMKKRTKVFYDMEDARNMMDPFEAMTKYVNDMESHLAKREFFGVDDGGDITKSIGDYVSKMVDNGELTSADGRAVGKLLMARFGRGEQGVDKWASDARNVTNSILLGNPGAAVIQLGDAAVSAAYNGARNTIQGMFQKGGLRMDDVGLNEIATELVGHKGKTQDVADWLLKYSGFRAADRLGKRAALNGALGKMWTMKKKGDIEGLRKTYGHLMSDTEFVEFVDAIPTNTRGQSMKQMASEKNTLVRMAAFSDLADIQPIALSEVPVSYLNARNGRLAYHLKSFVLKQFEAQRRKVFDEIRRGNVKEGTKNALRYITAVGLASGSTDFARDVATGKIRSVEDLDAAYGGSFADAVMQAYLGPFGNKYYMTKAFSRRGDDPLMAFWKDLVPAVSLGARAVSDLKELGYKSVEGKLEPGDAASLAKYIPYVRAASGWLEE